MDGERRIWVRPSTAEGADGAEWRVFTIDGEKVAELRLPPDAVVLDASDSLILVLRRSELDEESVEVWNLLAPGG